MARHGKPIFIVGGTGLYIRALVRGIIETPTVDENIRNHYRQLRDGHGKEYLYNLLKQRDADAAGKINPNDSIRVIRALEVLEQTGESISAKQKRHSFADCPYKTYKIGLQLARAELKQKIILRTEKMIAAGFLDEVKSIIDRGYSYNLKPLQSFLRKEYDWENALDLINRDIWHYAKRQLTWFAADKEINWFKPDLSGEIKKNVKKFWKDCTSA